MEKLKCCPFCGGEALLVENLIETHILAYYFYCPVCHIQILPRVVTNKIQAIAAWNRRTQNIGKKECSVQEEE